MEFKKFHKDLIKRSACKEALEYFESTKFQDMTLGEAMSLYLADNDAPISWAMWGLTIYKKQLDEYVRNILIQKIKDPMMAFSLYIRLPDLTDNEDNMLKHKFEGKLPQTEKELRDGVVKRGKDVNLD